MSRNARQSKRNKGQPKSADDDDNDGSSVERQPPPTLDSHSVAFSRASAAGDDGTEAPPIPMQRKKSNQKRQEQQDDRESETRNQGKSKGKNKLELAPAMEPGVLEEAFAASSRASQERPDAVQDEALENSSTRTGRTQPLGRDRSSRPGAYAVPGLHPTGDVISLADPSEEATRTTPTPTPQEYLVSAELVTDAPKPQDRQDAPSIYMAEVFDWRKKRCRVIAASVAVAIVIILAIVIPIVIVFSNKGNPGDGPALSTLPTTSPLPSATPTYAPTAAPSGHPSVAPSSSPTMSLAPSSAPTIPLLFEPVSNPILTDTVTVQSSSLSYNGRIAAVVQQETVQVYRLEANDWLPLGQALPGQVDTTAIHLAANALVLAIGEPTDQNDSGSVQVYAYNESASQWRPRGAVWVGNETDGFGYQVALSNDGDTLAIGASNYNNDEYGYVQVLTWNVSTEEWDLMGQVPGLARYDDLSLALAGPLGTYQGPRLALGDPNDGIVGRVKVYECNFDQGCFQLGQEMTGPDYEDFFGSQVQLSDSGKYLAIGAPGNIECCGRRCANVRVMEYERASESVWTLVGQELTGESEMGFGFRVRLSGDGTTVAIAFTQYVNDDCYEDVLGEQTQVYKLLSDGTWKTEGRPIQWPLLDMSRDASTLTLSGGNGTVIALGYTG